MTIAGNLKTMELSELLQWLSQAQKTGTLVCDNGQVEKRIFFRDGMIISSASTDPKEYLGHFLVSHGYISEAEQSRAMEMQETNKMLLGKILVTIGAISEADLHKMLRLKAEESIYDVFSWAEGEFRFIDNELPSSTMVPIALDVTAIVLEGMQRLDEWKRIREIITSTQCVPVAVGAFDEQGLDPGARLVLSLVNDDRSVEEVSLQTHASEYNVCRILFRQLQAGRLKMVRPRQLGGGGGDSSANLALSAEAMLQAARRYLQEGDFQSGLRYLRAARHLDPDSKRVQNETQKSEDRIRDQIVAEGIALTAVPQLAKTLDQLAQLKISPQEGFLLTRINGTYDVQSLLKISPIPQIEALLVLWKLLKGGHIRLEQRGRA